MNGQTDFSQKEFLKKIFEKCKDFLLKNKRNALIVCFIFFLYLFVVVLYQVFSQAPKPEAGPKQISYLDLMQFIGGYRDYQQDFEIGDLKFGEKFLNFNLEIKFKTKSILIIKKLAMDIMLGLIDEYPELESIKIKVIRIPDEGGIIVYGRSVYSRENESLSWSYE